MSTLTITAAAVEAAARQLFDQDSGEAIWGEVREAIRSHYREEVRAVLEAAAPHLMPEARGGVGELAQLIRDESNTYDGRYVVHPDHLADEIILAGWHK